MTTFEFPIFKTFIFVLYLTKSYRMALRLGIQPWVVQTILTFVCVSFLELDSHIFEVLQQFQMCFQLGAESGVDNPNLRAMKTVFRIMPFVILPLTINFPTVSLSHSLLPHSICDGIGLLLSCCFPQCHVICVFYRRCLPTG